MFRLGVFNSESADGIKSEIPESGTYRRGEAVRKMSDSQPPSRRVCLDNVKQISQRIGHIFEDAHDANNKINKYE